jgi:hypothetical protein
MALAAHRSEQMLFTHPKVADVEPVTDWSARHRSTSVASPGGRDGEHAHRLRIALPWIHAFRSVAPYLAAPTYLSLARLPLVTGGLFCCRSRIDHVVRKNHDIR